MHDNWASPARRAGLTVATALALLAVTNVAQAAPKNPTDGQISAAQAAKDAAAAQIGRITAQLAQQQAAVDAAHAKANIALGTFEHKQADYQAAADAATKAQQQAAAARAAQADAQAKVAAFARQSYMSGSTSPGFAAVLTSDGPEQMLERQSLLAAANGHRTDVLKQMTAAQQRAAAASAAASKAADTAATLKAQAQADLNAASALEAHARQQAATLQTQQTQMQAQLTAAQTTLYGLEGARAAAQAYAAQQAAAQAAANTPKPQPEPAPAPAPQPGPSAGPGSASAAQTAINAAMRYVGTSYAWGGGSLTGPSEGFGIDDGVIGFDCSGLTRYAYAQAGIILPRVSSDQYAAYPKVHGALQPGDLLFWATDTSNPSTIHHVALYLGGGQMIEAPESGLTVRVTTARTGSSEYIGAVRPTA